MNRFTHKTDFCISLLAVLFAGCTSAETTTDTSASSTDTTAEASSALQSAQCDFQSFKAAADACFATFASCKSDADAGTGTVDACKSALHECLPPAPPSRHKGSPPPRGPNDTDDIGEDHPPPPADGGAPPKGEHGPHGKVDKGKGGGPGPDSDAIQACHDALAACLSADGADQEACVSTEDACVREAFRGPFKAKCADAEPKCAEDGASDSCTNVKRCCKDGVDGPPRNDGDGGLQCQPASE